MSTFLSKSPSCCTIKSVNQSRIPIKTQIIRKSFIIKFSPCFCIPKTRKTISYCRSINSYSVRKSNFQKKFSRLFMNISNWFVIIPSAFTFFRVLVKFSAFWFSVYITIWYRNPK